MNNDWMLGFKNAMDYGLTIAQSKARISEQLYAGSVRHSAAIRSCDIFLEMHSKFIRF